MAHWTVHQLFAPSFRSKSSVFSIDHWTERCQFQRREQWNDSCHYRSQSRRGRDGAATRKEVLELDGSAQRLHEANGDLKPDAFYIIRLDGSPRGLAHSSPCRSSTLRQTLREPPLTHLPANAHASVIALALKKGKRNSVAL